MYVKKSHSGFTLVELLVVIGIIALLVSILLPALNRARESALSVQCMSNQRQVFTALSLYVNDFRGMLPYNSNWNTSLTNTDWRHKLSRYISEDPNYQVYNWSYHPLFECPSKVYTDANAYTHLSLDGKGFKPGTAINRAMYEQGILYKISQIRDAAGTFFTADTPDGLGYTGIPNSAYALSLYPNFIGFHHKSRTFSANPIVGQNKRSGGTGNITFMDGHVESRSISAIGETFWGLH